MTTQEVIAELTQHPHKTFKRQCWTDKYVTSHNGCLGMGLISLPHLNPDHCYWSLETLSGTDWEEIYL